VIFRGWLGAGNDAVVITNSVPGGVDMVTIAINRLAICSGKILAQFFVKRIGNMLRGNQRHGFSGTKAAVRVNGVSRQPLGA